MKFLISIAIALLLGHTAQAQLVLTVAGVVEESGSTDGNFYEATFNNPHGIAVDGNGNIYVADRYNNQIRKITAEGMVSTLAGSGEIGDADGFGTEASFNEPWGLCADAEGNVYVADTRNNKIRKIDTEGNVTTVAGTGNYGTINGPTSIATFGNPTGIELDAEGNLIVADHLTHIIRKIDTEGNVSTIAGLAYVPGFNDGPAAQATFHRPYGLHIGQNGVIYIADEWNHKIRQIDLEGNVTTVAGIGVIGNNDGAAEESTFNYPWDITTDNAGNLYVADGYNYTIRKITTQGNVSTFAGTIQTQGAQDGIADQATFNGVTSIAFEPVESTFYLGDAYNHLIRKIISLDVGVSIFSSNEGVDVCANEALTISASPAIYESFEFYLNGDLQETSSNNIYTFENLPEGEIFVEVVAFNGGQEWVSNQMVFNVLNALQADISIIGEQEILPGDSTILVASSATEYYWSNGATTPTITVAEPGDYFVDLVDENGCVWTSELISINWIESIEVPVVSLLGGDFICFGEETLLESSFAIGNQWYKNGWPLNGETGQNLYVNEAGTYQVRYTNQDGVNVFSNEVAIESGTQQIFDFNASQLSVHVVNNQVAFTCNCGEGLTYFWEFGDGSTSTDANPTFSYNSEGTFTVKLTTNDANGCTEALEKNAYITVAGDNEPPTPVTAGYFIPNAFTPDGDNLNDLFQVAGQYEAVIDMTIFNQWGQCVYTSNNSNAFWDGTNGGTKVETGTYVYQINLRKSDGTSICEIGHISVIY